jgi:hypothetical protein
MGRAYSRHGEDERNRQKDEVLNTAAKVMRRCGTAHDRPHYRDLPNRVMKLKVP